MAPGGVPFLPKVSMTPWRACVLGLVLTSAVHSAAAAPIPPSAAFEKLRSLVGNWEAKTEKGAFIRIPSQAVDLYRGYSCCGESCCAATGIDASVREAACGCWKSLCGPESELFHRIAAIRGRKRS